MLDPFNVLGVVFDGIDAVEWERGEQGDAEHRLAHAGDGDGVFVAEQMTAEAGLGALGILEFHDGHALDGFLAHAEQACGNLCDDVVVIRPHAFHVTTLAGAGERVERHCRPGLRKLGYVADRAERHAAAVPGNVNFDFGPAVAALVQRDARVDLALVELDGRFVREFEPEPVKAAAGIAAFVVEIVGLGRHISGLGHLPRRQNQIRRPAIIAERGEHGIFPDRQSPLRAMGHAILIRLFAGRPDAQVMLGLAEIFEPGFVDVDAIGADLHALAAAFAV